MSSKFKAKTRNFICNVKTCDEYALIILIETYFRPTIFRFAEYALYLILRFVNLERANQMTIGVNQLKAICWISYLEKKHSTVSFIQMVLACEDIVVARESTMAYLSSKSFNFFGKEKISLIYTGRSNYYYDSLFQFALSNLASFKESQLRLQQNKITKKISNASSALQ